MPIDENLSEEEIAQIEQVPREPTIDVVEGANPWTHLDLQNDPDHFSFAIAPDLTGGYRSRVFEAGVARLNLLRPEFVMSVGDLIEGYTEDPQEIYRQWDAFSAMLKPLVAPFFYVPGNHDYSNEVMRQIWRERLGRDYYHFVYRNVLFLAINTEEVYTPFPPEAIELFQEAQALKDTDPEAAASLLERVISMLDPNGNMPAEISHGQARYFEDVVRQHPEVRWTFLFMHQPIWQADGNAQLDRIEAAFGKRPFTVFAGHSHNYRRFEVGGRLHIRLGTLGGMFTLPRTEGSWDHVTLITMTDDGPSIANLLLDGIVHETGKIDPASRGWRND